MRYRPINTEPEDQRLGRYVPGDWSHVERYPITELSPAERPARRPVVIGVNWYSEMDTPEKDASSGEFFVARRGAQSLTTIRGGHCVCLEPGGEPDRADWHSFYDQGREGACVGFGWSRCMTILNDQLYAARWLWDRAKETDEWPETNPGDSDGTSVRAAGEILVGAGHVDWDASYAEDDHVVRARYKADRTDGLTTFRWATTVDEVHQTLDNPRADQLGAVPILNSWGTSYPQRVWLPDEVLDRLIGEDGEIAVPTDR